MRLLKKSAMLILGLIGILIVMLIFLRAYDHFVDQKQWSRLTASQPMNPRAFDPSMISQLPEPVRRFFHFAIEPGTPLLTVAEIEMGGEFSLGSREDPKYQLMTARQILAAPTGFLWRLSLPGWVSGSDFGSEDTSWTRFRVLGLIPVARVGGDANHLRAAFGRYIAEAVFWTPAALLPSQGIVWTVIDENTVRVSVTRKTLSQEVEIRIDASGQPLIVKFQRWSNANKDKQYRLQPFGGYLSNFQTVQGYRIPFDVEAGNMFGTSEYFAFFKAKLKSVRFPTSREDLSDGTL